MTEWQRERLAGIRIESKIIARRGGNAFNPFHKNPYGATTAEGKAWKLGVYDAQKEALRS